MEKTCRCQTETHGHKAGKCTKPATEPDHMCKPCSDKAADKQAKSHTPLSEPRR
jgi:hypothetical protein